MRPHTERKDAATSSATVPTKAAPPAARTSPISTVMKVTGAIAGLNIEPANLGQTRRQRSRPASQDSTSSQAVQAHPRREPDAVNPRLESQDQYTLPTQIIPQSPPESPKRESTQQPETKTSPTETRPPKAPPRGHPRLTQKEVDSQFMPPPTMSQCELRAASEAVKTKHEMWAPQISSYGAHDRPLRRYDEDNREGKRDAVALLAEETSQHVTKLIH